MSAPAVLLTGFRPFDVFDLNSSYEMLRPLSGAALEGHVVHVVETPVVFGDCMEPLLERAAAVDPRLVISFGLADSPHVRLERTAFNEVNARIPDNSGAQPLDGPVLEGGPGKYSSTLPLVAMEQALGDASVPVEYSDTAGRFVCNDIFYRLMHWGQTTAPGVLCGFVHVPPLEGHGGKRGWELSRLEEAARLMVAAAIRGL